MKKVSGTLLSFCVAKMRWGWCAVLWSAVAEGAEFTSVPADTAFKAAGDTRIADCQVCCVCAKRAHESAHQKNRSASSRLSNLRYVRYGRRW
ncbi:MAG: hypothetical protein LBT53_02750 [Puniceicoccales bacterium]|jgi:hypothetical protein|nr:hypothetical protein [Puniceicoccales bacterium]